jgi:hypothetical protein
MNILSAIKSGRPFKRPLWSEYHAVISEPGPNSLQEIRGEDSFKPLLPMVHTLLADDFELKPIEPIKIECSWIMQGQVAAPAIANPVLDVELQKILRLFVGKQTKLTIEVMDEP